MKRIIISKISRIGLALLLLIACRSAAHAFSIDASATFHGNGGQITLYPPISGSCTAAGVPFTQCSGVGTSATLPSALINGECLVLFFQDAENQSEAFPTGWTGAAVPVSTNAGWNSTFPVGLHKYATGETSYTFYVGGYPANYYGSIQAVGGTNCYPDTTLPVPNTDTGSAGATSVVSSSINTAHADIVFTGVGTYGTAKQDCTGTSTWNAPTGLTTVANDGFTPGDNVTQQYAGLAVFYGIQSVPGTSMSGVTVTPPCNMRMYTVTLPLQPAAVATPTPTPTPSCNAGVTTTDPTFTHGTATVQTTSINSANSTSADVNDASGKKIWNLVASAWGTSATFGTCPNAAGDGCTITTYTPNSGVTMRQTFATGSGATGTNTCTGYVAGYSFFNLGLQSFPANGGILNTTQPPTFPATLSGMCSLIYDVAYTAAGSFFQNTDYLFDQWLMPTVSNPGGTPASLEVEIPPYINFGTGAQLGSKFIQTIQHTVLINGVSTPITFTQYIGAVGGEAGDTSFLPSVILSGGEYQIDVMPLMNAASAAFQANCGNGSVTGGTCWNTASGWSGSPWLAGTNFGTEWGQGNGCLAPNTSFDYTLTTTKYAITQTGFATGGGSPSGVGSGMGGGF